MLGVVDACEIGALERLKRDVLFFDKVIICNISALRDSTIDPAAIATNLEEFGYLCETPHFTDKTILDRVSTSWKTFEEADKYFEHSYYVERLNAAASELNHLHMLRNLGKSSIELAHRLERARRLYSSYSTRLEAELRRNEENEAVITCDSFSYDEQSLASSMSQAEVLKLSLKSVPLPGPSHPWEEIFDLKRDKAFQEKLLKLRVWCHQVSRNSNDPKIIEEYVLDSLADYEAYLRALNLKFQSTLLQEIIVGGAEIVEDFMKLRIGKLAARCFSAQKFRADMMLSEMKAPGRSVAVLTQLRKRFTAEPPSAAEYAPLRSYPRRNPTVFVPSGFHG